jgi:hypothetical protein
MQSVAPIGKRKFEQRLDCRREGDHHQRGDEGPPLPVLPVHPEIPVSRSQGNMKMKGADEQEQGEHKDEVIIGSGEPRLFPGVWFRWNFESLGRHWILLT